ncbi:hypothetical protein [Photobacterium leiognathi]|uniref:hypothetical protein n=1 Tax=Photobacterium leiognathi TaxID=553611 RepID=UPI002981B4FF|nr:hypothetical protein [Photobacterium leiognathi]
MLKIKILIVSTLFSASAMAGTGWHITFVNKTSSSLHISEDRNEECWYSGSFDHENFIPKGSKERYYTEIKNSGDCFFAGKRWTINDVSTDRGEYTFRYRYDKGKCRIVINNIDIPNTTLFETECSPGFDKIHVGFEVRDSKITPFTLKSFQLKNDSDL